MRAILEPPPAPPGTAPAAAVPLDRPRLAGAFELACLVRATALTRPSATRTIRSPWFGPDPGVVEFNVEAAARRTAQLLRYLDVPAYQEASVAGLRRRYELYRIIVPEAHRTAYSTLVGVAWQQGRASVLSTVALGTTAPANTWRLRMAGAAWRGVLLTAGRHMRKHILGVRVTDQDLATVLVRGAQLLDAHASLVRRGGSFLISVPNGPAAGRLLRGAQLCDAAVPESTAGGRQP
ncbi:hypothetical protein [Polymorphospora sp. NPDC050346]|uniref:hypothetical protein n=1 Tax=Polymorphospora sp. NPDC050346 TaxID=3155780 RepID=UPI0033FBBC65